MNFNRKYLSLWASVAFGLFFFGASPALAQTSLGTAQSFGVLGGSTVTNTGSSTVIGDLGVSPGTSVTGFPPGTVTGGTIHLNDAVAAQAQSDVTTAFNAIAGTACTVDLSGQNLGGLTLTPGVYCFSSSAQLTGMLTLNALGNPNALFIFKIGSTLTTASASSVQVINPASDCNVFWQVGSSATLGTSTSFVGNILALSSITLNTGATVHGRVLARNGAVTIDTGNVIVAGCGPTSACPVITVNPAKLPNGLVGTPYSQTVSATGGTLPFTFTVSIGALPNGLTLNATTGVISGTPTAAGPFTFTITATDANGCFGSRPYSIVILAVPGPVVPGCPFITVSPATLAAAVLGTPYSQTITASGGTPPFTFRVSSGALPPGLTLSSTSGTTAVISGTPTTNGSFSFTITATDANGCPGSQTYFLQLPAGPPGGGPPGGGSVPTLSEWGAILMALLIIAACIFFLAGHSKAATSLAGAVSSTAFTGEEKPLDWKLLARTAMYVEAAIALALIALSANPVDILGALTSGLVAAFILHLLIGGARRG